MSIRDLDNRRLQDSSRQTEQSLSSSTDLVWTEEVLNQYSPYTVALLNGTMDDTLARPDRRFPPSTNIRADYGGFITGITLPTGTQAPRFASGKDPISLWRPLEAHIKEKPAELLSNDQLKLLASLINTVDQLDRKAIEKELQELTHGPRGLRANRAVWLQVQQEVNLIVLVEKLERRREVFFEQARQLAGKLKDNAIEQEHLDLFAQGKCSAKEREKIIQLIPAAKELVNEIQVEAQVRKNVEAARKPYIHDPKFERWLLLNDLHRASLSLRRVYARELDKAGREIDAMNVGEQIDEITTGPRQPGRGGMPLVLPNPSVDKHDPKYVPPPLKPADRVPSKIVKPIVVPPPVDDSRPVVMPRNLPARVANDGLLAGITLPPDGLRTLGSYRYGDRGRDRTPSEEVARLFYKLSKKPDDEVLHAYARYIKDADDAKFTEVKKRLDELFDNITARPSVGHFQSLALTDAQLRDLMQINQARTLIIHDARPRLERALNQGGALSEAQLTARIDNTLFATEVPASRKLATIEKIAESDPELAKLCQELVDGLDTERRLKLKVDELDKNYREKDRDGHALWQEYRFWRMVLEAPVQLRRIYIFQLERAGETAKANQERLALSKLTGGTDQVPKIELPPDKTPAKPGNPAAGKPARPGVGSSKPIIRPDDLSELNDPILSLEAARKWAARESFNELRPRLEANIFKADALNIDAFVEEMNNIEKRLFLLRKPEIPQGAAYREYLAAEATVSAKFTELNTIIEEFGLRYVGDTAKRYQTAGIKNEDLEAIADHATPVAKRKEIVYKLRDAETKDPALKPAGKKPLSAVLEDFQAALAEWQQASRSLAAAETNLKVVTVDGTRINVHEDVKNLEHYKKVVMSPVVTRVYYIQVLDKALSASERALPGTETTNKKELEQKRTTLIEQLKAWGFDKDGNELKTGSWLTSKTDSTFVFNTTYKEAQNV